MKLLIPLILLTGCATQQPTPYDFAIHETHKRVLFNSKNDYNARDYTVVKAGEERWGNCATFAATAASILNERGIKTAVGECKSYWGPHAFAVIVGKGMVVDSLHSSAIPISDLGCKWR